MDKKEQNKCEKKTCGCENHETQCECNQTDEYLLLAQRIKAEFENYKKRNAEIASQSFDNGVASAVEKLLPALDSFKQAKSNITDENVTKGLDMILAQILSGFENLGVEKIDCLDRVFDPNFHNAVFVGKDESKEDGIVLEEYQEGFIYKGRVIRHSVVKINKLS